MQLKTICLFPGSLIPAPVKRRKIKLLDSQSMVRHSFEESLKPLRDDLNELKSKFNATMFKIDRLAHTVNESTDNLRTQLFVVMAILVVFQSIVSLFFGSKIGNN